MLFLLLEEWFKDRYLYHVIGFLVIQQEGLKGASISRIIRKLADASANKTDFKRKLKDEIFNRVFDIRREKLICGPEEIRKVITEFLTELDYSSSRNAIRNVLLLFNVVSLLENAANLGSLSISLKKSSGISSIFDQSSRICPVDQMSRSAGWPCGPIPFGRASVVLGEKQAAVEQVSSSAIQARVVALLGGQSFDSEAFRALFNEIIELYDPAPDFEADNSIGNLTLLDAATNRSYKNAIFPI